tara:strand:+ start:194 stop:481 length:288 start_codon:yes stop_codon:yes gene_type:complete
MSIEETLKSRKGRYGKATDNALISQSLMDVIVHNAPSYKEWTPLHRMVVQMIFQKISRMSCGDPDYPDNMHDIIGYAKILENFQIDKEKGIPHDN